MINPTVTIALKPLLQAYLAHEFHATNDWRGEGIRVDGNSELGQYILSLVCIADRPPKIEAGAYALRLLLPISEWNHHLFRENFLYVPLWKQRLLQLHTEASFRMHLREYFVVGYEKGYRQNKIIEAFLAEYNAKTDLLNFETVKKYDYRRRQRTLADIKNDINLLIN
jgi:hypothetical protein